MEYLKNRGLADEVITHFGLGYSNKTSDDLYRYFKEKGYSDDVLKETGLFSFSEIWSLSIICPLLSIALMPVTFSTG